MNLGFFSPHPYSSFDSDIFNISNAPNHPLIISWQSIYERSQLETYGGHISNHEGRSWDPQQNLKKSLKKNTKRYRDKTNDKPPWATHSNLKKTHVFQFTVRQKKCKRPRPIAEVFLSGPNLIRFGTFSGIRDNRTTRCPLRGIAHSVFIKRGKQCSCQAFTLYPSPLLSLAKPEKCDIFNSSFNVCKSS